jgi:hypothetical protein
MTSEAAGGHDRQFPKRERPADSPRLSPLEEERREILESVFGAIGTEPPDADRKAAWFHLLRHLNGSRRSPRI